MLKLYILISLLSSNLLATIWVITTEDYLGQIAIARDDYIIVSPDHSLATHYGHTHRIICESNQCISDNIRRLKHKWRTRGISIVTIADH